MALEIASWDEPAEQASHAFSQISKRGSSQTGMQEGRLASWYGGGYIWLFTEKKNEAHRNTTACIAQKADQIMERREEPPRAAN